MSTNKKANRLIQEKSPYLLQHAYNPVDWYPWGNEAFEKAQAEDKPIFLSIGYSTCHWCHVMERESFEDEGVAELLNRDFISIKVDREERPDIDHIYMQVCQALTGHGGWPLTIIMTPEQHPFFAATYIPRESRSGMAGLMGLLPQVARLWKEERESLINTGQHLLDWLQNRQEASFSSLDKTVLDKAYEQFEKVFDADYGGFGTAPKFPSPHQLMFLLRYYYHTGQERALYMVEKTLQQMFYGGIYDHIGFGFARYATDWQWLIPHFEKMLYDNALLIMAYLDVYQITSHPLYERVVRQTLEYILRDLSSPAGAFYSAEDADSEGEEGRFYLWELEEVQEILSDHTDHFCNIYGISEGGNYEGKNLPNLIKSRPDLEIIQELDPLREKLFLRREGRVHPYKDDKILTGWNGLMIAALARAARVLQDERYTIAARNAAEFIYSHLFRPDGRLLARYREGEARYPAYAADYAYLGWGLLELYATTYDANWLKRAVELHEDLWRLFGDEQGGGLFLYGKDSEVLISRPKESYDGAMPSGNAVAARNFLHLSRLTGEPYWSEYADRQFTCFANEIKDHPSAYTFWLLAFCDQWYPGKDLVLLADRTDQKIQAFISHLQKTYRPDFLMLWKEAGREEEIAKLAAHTTEMRALQGEPTAYLCQNLSCSAPSQDFDALLKELDKPMDTSQLQP